MNIDAGILTGVTGAILATVSLVYARSQAHAQRHQVEEMQRQTEETRRAQHFETSHALMKDAIEARQAWAANFRKEWAPPTIGTPLEKALALLDENWDVLFRVRAYVEQLQEMFFARKADLVADDHWCVMHWLVRSFFAPEIDRTIFESFIEMGWVTPEFAKFGRDYVADAVWKDPLGRLAPIQGRGVDFGTGGTEKLTPEGQSSADGSQQNINLLHATMALECAADIFFSLRRFPRRLAMAVGPGVRP